MVLQITPHPKIMIYR